VPLTDPPPRPAAPASVGRVPASAERPAVAGRVPADGAVRVANAPVNFGIYAAAAPTTLTVFDTRNGVQRRTEPRGGTAAFERQLVAFHEMVTAGAEPLTGVAGGASDIETSQQVVRRFGTRTGAAIGGEAARA
jgi:hypothetical protein